MFSPVADRLLIYCCILSFVHGSLLCWPRIVDCTRSLTHPRPLVEGFYCFILKKGPIIFANQTLYNDVRSERCVLLCGRRATRERRGSVETEGRSLGVWTQQACERSGARPDAFPCAPVVRLRVAERCSGIGVRVRVRVPQAYMAKLRAGIRFSVHPMYGTHSGRLSPSD